MRELDATWLRLKRLVGINPATPLSTQEGQIRYARDGDVDGVLYLAQHKTGHTYTWQRINLQQDTGYFNVPGPVAIDATQVTALSSGNSGARYIGMTPFNVTSVEVRVAVTTAVATSITWAEMALASAASATSGNLTLLGSATDVTSTFDSTGNKTVTFTVSIPAGTFVHLVFGSAATTPFQLRATIADELGLGLTRTSSSTRPSTMSAPTAFSTSTALTAAAWTVVRWT